MLKGSQQTHPPLFQLRSFWVTVLIPIIFAGAIWYLIFQSLDYPDLLLTKEGFDRAYEYFKIPLWIAALSLPLAGFYASHHRSTQTAAQIEAAEEKTNFENYTKHVDQFKNELKRLSDRYNIEVSDDMELYRLIFPLNSYDYFSPWADTMEYKGIGDDSFVFFHKNYLAYVRNRFSEILDFNNFNGTDTDSYKIFEMILFYLRILKIQGIDIRDKAQNDQYFILDNKFYTPAFEECLKGLSNFFVSLETICLSTIYIDKINKKQRFSVASLCIHMNKPPIIRSVYRTNGNGHVKEIKGTFQKFKALGRTSNAKKKRWEKQVARISERKLL